jgi:hypothetical protein
MKQQIVRLSPHQNGKVFGILSGIASLIFLVPFYLTFAATMPPNMPGPPKLMFLLGPVFYLVFTYVSVVVACWLYNLMYRYIGGIEYEQATEPAN